MGQYFIAVNQDRKEWIHPHRFGDGLKFMEFLMSSTGFLAGLALLIRQSNEGGGGDWYGYAAPDEALKENQVVGSWAGDRIAIVGDYDESGLFTQAMDSWTDVSEPIIEALAKDSSAKLALRNRLDWRQDHCGEGDPERLFFERVLGPNSGPTFQSNGREGRAMEGKTSDG